jgi:D-lactate dehydrogenase (cytochrome)
VRYGTMRENVLSLTVVTPDGRIRTAAPREEVVGRLRPDAPVHRFRRHAGRHHRGDGPAVSGARGDVQRRWRFPSLPPRSATVIQTIQLGVPVARIELLDDSRRSADQCAQQDHAARSADPVLRVPWLPTGVKEQAETRAGDRRRARRPGLRMGHPPRGPHRLWNARHNAYYACLQACARLPCDLTDTCVPISRWPTASPVPIAILDTAVPAMLLGHVGDGNFHAGALIDPTTARN